MNSYKNFILKKITAFIFIIFFNKEILPASLDGTSSLVYKTQHHVFSDGNYAQGFVRMNGGFTIKSNAKASLDTVISVSSGIDLRTTGTLQLLKDLYLDANVSWSSGGCIRGRGNSIILSGDLSIPASSIIYITSDTIIDGKGKSLILGANSKFSIESNSTLTFRNITIKNTRNSPTNTFIKCNNSNSSLAFDNAIIDQANDMTFALGKLYIHNDVIFRGTSSFIYTSPSPCFVFQSSTLYFDIDTTFSFAPASSTEGLFILQDRKSSLYLNGCTLKTTTSGMRLTKGSLIFDNKVTIQTNPGTPTPQALSKSLIFGKSSLGESYDLNVEVLGGAYVIIDGKIVDDSA